MLIKTNSPQIGLWLAGIYTDRDVLQVISVTDAEKKEICSEVS